MVYAPERLQPRHLLRPGAQGDAGDRCGYLATQDIHGEFRECEFPLEELEELEKTLKAISLPLRSSVGTPDRGSGLIRIYNGHEGWIDFFYRSIDQPQWDSLLAFIHETTERLLIDEHPSPQIVSVAIGALADRIGQMGSPGNRGGVNRYA